jgi:drug/metabolite transporter (DMT)-like permease
MKSITWLGAIIGLLGICGLAIPVFTTSQPKTVVALGDLKVQSTEESTYVVPQQLSIGALVLGAILIGAGTYAKRQEA